MTIVHIDPPFDDEERRRRLFAGDLVVHSHVPAVLDFVEYTRDRLVRALAPHDPLTVHHHVEPEQLAALLVDLKPAFIHDPASKRHLLAVVEALGADLDEYHVDLPKLRTSYGERLNHGIAHAFAAHRDTWYAAPQSQINWWFPLWPVSDTNAMAFFPDRFDQPVDNTSGRYNYYLANVWRGQVASFPVGQDPRVHPQAEPELPADETRLCPIPPVGGILLFSAAQLHASIPNTSGVARYSVDFRTVHAGDAAAGRGAPAVDVHCTGTAIRDFRSGSTGERLPQSTIDLHENLDDLDGLTLEYEPPA